MSENSSSDREIDVRFLLNRKDAQAHEAAVLDVQLRFAGYGVSAVFGHSGCGKTSLLRCFAGLEKDVSGHLTVNGQIWQNKNIFLPTYRRPIGYVFQEASLFPQLTAMGNLNFAIKRSSKPFNSDLFDKVLAIMAIENLLDRFPHQLSGGERQRVAIARALLIQPQLLLMDEPLASLDQNRKREILPYLERLKSTFSCPIIYVSHSIDEVARLADQVLMMAGGRIVAQGNTTEIFSRLDLSPNWDNDSGVILPGIVEAKDTQWHLMRVGFDGGSLWLPDDASELNQPIRIRILAKDVSIALTQSQDSSILNRIAVSIDEIANDQDPSMALIRLKATNQYLVARLTRRSVAQLELCVGKSVWAQIKSVAIVH